jgi:hypothetical protein
MKFQEGRQMSIEEIAYNLAEAMGHKTTCGILNCKCSCGSGNKQAKALDDYIRWKKGERKP